MCSCSSTTIQVNGPNWLTQLVTSYNVVQVADSLGLTYSIPFEMDELICAVNSALLNNSILLTKCALGSKLKKYAAKVSRDPDDCKCSLNEMLMLHNWIEDICGYEFCDSDNECLTPDQIVDITRRMKKIVDSCGCC